MEDHGILYHLIPTSTWEACKTSKELYYPPTYAQDGFIHLTKEANMLLTVANHFYTDVKGDYVVLEIASAALTSVVKFEPAADVGDKKSSGLQDEHDPILFPHLYGSIDFESVKAELAVTRSEDGRFLSIEGF
mmetsp:Transcript_11900/g.16129  ORF Transcript_11900/g.16129 Transcript_11900/m.16129 type:complete len:133 (+) Transcript_11900:64-462(+)|eukprot:CAMPEP_0196585916 /NCGR_PEP_ID=MMETSP1081-20130531/52535_1 /TAXON_ID=36882 /ORGANISM="Pyramimonas amylifera, Strain CCMP720" /LENGTH=132 /DNA_ID=CAMNT_0041907619 /DNA_START=69 /DNA_END=467 /DNA_ORIENTATION=+